MRRLLIILITLGSVVLAGNSVSAGTFSVAGKPTKSVPVEASAIVSNNTVGTLNVPVPTGLKASRIAFVVNKATAANGVDYVEPGKVTVSYKGKKMWSGKAAGETVSFNLPKNAKPVKGVLSFSVAYAVPDLTKNFCSTNQQSISISNVAVTWVKTVSDKVLRVSDFIVPGVPAVNVIIPDSQNSAVNQAALQAVASIQNTIGSQGNVVLSYVKPDVELSKVPGVRNVYISGSQANVTVKVNTNVDVPTLEIKGEGDKLSEAARALGGPAANISTAKEATDLSYKDTLNTNMTKSIKDLGADEVTLSGWGEVSRFIGVPQAAFNGPVKNVKVRVKGVGTQGVTGAKTVLRVLWNDNLIGTKELTSSDMRFDDVFDVPDSQLNSDNGLSFVLLSVPPEGKCVGPIQRIFPEVSLDTGITSVSTERGDTLGNGFARFPQVFGNVLNTWFPSGNGTGDVISAAYTTAALQRVNPYVFTVVNATGEAPTGGGVLVVGANSETSTSLKSPMRLTEFRAVDTPNMLFNTGVDAGYSALQGFSAEGRNVLMLGAWSPNSEGENLLLERGLAKYVYSNPDGFRAFYADLVVWQPETGPINISTNNVVPQQEVIDETNFMLRWGIFAILLIFGIIIAAAWWRSRRNAKLAKTIVDGQEKYDSEHNSDVVDK